MLSAVAELLVSIHDRNCAISASSELVDVAPVSWPRDKISQAALCTCSVRISHEL